ncbi:hypothetical protein OSTOST_12243 [Ostertagia ostertagi]
MYFDPLILHDGSFLSLPHDNGTERSTAKTCLLIGPTTDAPIAKKDWCRLASSLPTAARMGMKIIAVAPPRGDKAYEQNRSDLNDAINLAKSSAVLRVYVKSEVDMPPIRAVGESRFAKQQQTLKYKYVTCDINNMMSSTYKKISQQYRV